MDLVLGKQTREPRRAEALALRFLEIAEYVTRAHARQLQGRYGLSNGRYRLLLLLSAPDTRRPRPADLAERAGLSRAAVTRLLDSLVRDGLVVRRADPEDRRAKRVELTAAGRGVVQAVAPRHARRLEALTRHLSEEDRRQLERLLERLRAGLAALSGA